MEKGKQRGSAWSIKLAFRVYDILGYRFLYILLYPITFFYFLVAKNAREPLKLYYENLGIAFNSRIFYRHLRVFAICFVDRFASKINPENYSFDYGEKKVPSHILNSGCILIYSHIGGWAASSNGAHVDNKINIVMQEAMLDGIKELERTLGLKSQLHIIDLNQGTIAVSVQIANALMNEEVVAVMADRAANEKAEQEVYFLGKKAKFNKNPFQIAYKTSKPMLAYFILWTDIQTYKVEYIEIHLDKEKKEAQAVEEALGKYVNKLEKIVKKYPEQWFNFYDFWEKK